MSGADEILDQIDHALRDFTVSPDAMRWSPGDPPSRPDMVVVDESYTWAHPPADLRPLIAAINANVRQSVAASRRRWLEQIPPGTPVVLGFDGSWLDADAVVLACSVQDDEDHQARRFWLNIPIRSDEAPGEGAP